MRSRPRRHLHVVLIKLRRQHNLLWMFGGMCLVLMLRISCRWSTISVLHSKTTYLVNDICVTNNHGYVLLVVKHFPDHSALMTYHRVCWFILYPYQAIERLSKCKSEHRSFSCCKTLLVKLLVKFISVINNLQVLLFTPRW
jgi:hypothetical protein